MNLNIRTVAPRLRSDLRLQHAAGTQAKCRTLMRAALVTAPALLASCSGSNGGGSTNAVAANAIASAPPSVAKPSATASASAVAGFDPTTAPVANPTLGSWPYFGVMDGYEKGTLQNSASMENKKYFADAAFDRYDFFDGVKTIPVEGRLFTTDVHGKGASFFQVQKTYEKLVHDLGGVTVFEGTGAAMNDNKIKFIVPRFRANYRVQDDQMGVYMVRTPTGAIWVEVYHPWEDESQDYWLTVVEQKALDVKVKMLPAAEMEKALDSAGHVALYINFDTDKASIKPDSQPIIAEIVKLLRASPDLRLTVEGHTDNAGTPAHNQSLSEARANSVVAQLIAAGIPLDRLQSKGFGQSKPIADNSTDDGRAKNRRVELVKR